MKLLIFTPVSVKSAIGRMTALVTRELLINGHHVTVVSTEAKHLLLTNIHDFGTSVLSWHDESAVLELVYSSDVCVYQIGNNFEYHEGGIRWLADFPGLVCLHDFFLGNLFYNWAKQNKLQAEIVLENWYGTVMVERFFSYSDSESFIEGTREVMPMTEWIASQATGIITHSEWGCDRVLSSCPGPVRVVPLAYDAPGRVVDNPIIRSASGRVSINLLTIGHMNQNKRVESVIKAIGLSPLLRQRVRYRLVGAVEQNVISSLSNLAAQLGVNLVISGEVDDIELVNAISESNVVSCLRWPVLEAASASAIEAMLYGKAVIVTDIGFYAGIPDSCAIKIKHSNEIIQIHAALISLLEDSTQFVSIGSLARSWSAKTFTAINYAQQLEEIVIDIFRTRPVINAIDNLYLQLRKWSNVDDYFLTEELMRKLDIFEVKCQNNSK